MYTFSLKFNQIQFKFKTAIHPNELTFRAKTQVEEK
jgi:hypothetical protein